MTPVLQYRTEIDNGIAVASTTVDMASMNRASWRHRRFGLEFAPGHRDFRPGMEGVC